MSPRASYDLDAVLGALDAVAGILVHDVRTPTTVVLGNLRMVLEELFGTLPEGQRRALEAADRQAHRLDRMLEAALAALEPAALVDPGEPVEVDLGALLRRLGTVLGREAQVRGGAHLRAPMPGLELALGELLGALQGQGPVEVLLGQRAEGAEIGLPGRALRDDWRHRALLDRVGGLLEQAEGGLRVRLASFPPRARGSWWALRVEPLDLTAFRRRHGCLLAALAVDHVGRLLRGMARYGEFVLPVGGSAFALFVPEDPGPRGEEMLARVLAVRRPRLGTTRVPVALEARWKAIGPLARGAPCSYTGDELERLFEVWDGA